MIALILSILLVLSNSLNNGQALTPPLMVSTSRFGCQISESFIYTEIDYLLSSGLFEAGFKTILIEDCWQKSRNGVGQIKEDSMKFQKGIANLVKYAHDKGFKVGLGTDIGPLTRSGNPGSQGFYHSDSLSYKNWNVDMVSISNVMNLSNYRQIFQTFSHELLSVKGDFIISFDTRSSEVAHWAGAVSNLWTTARPTTSWESLSDSLQQQKDLEVFAKPGAWNNAGSLLSTLSDSQFLAQLSAYVTMKSPLIVEAPVSSYSAEKLKLLRSQLLKVHQDGLRRPGVLIRHEQYQKGWEQVWGCQLAGNKFILVFINGQLSQSSMSVSLKKQAKIGNFSSYVIKDLIRNVVTGTSTSDIVTVDKIAGHSVEVRVLQF